MPTVNSSTGTNSANSSQAHGVSEDEWGSPQSPTLGERYAEWSRDGWTDAELGSYISRVIDSGDIRPHIQPLWQAVLTPEMPLEAERDPKFMEVLAWYIDKSTSSPGNGKLTLSEVRESLVEYGKKYFSLVGQAGQDVSRLQAWKFIQKLRILEGEILSRVGRGEGDFYPYSARDMMTIDSSSRFNQTNTIRSRIEFEEKVKTASFDKPVLVKFGLTYCAHCLLLEQLGSVPAVAEKYSEKMNVYKVWWNPHDRAFSEMNTIAGEHGVTSSPIFMLYKDGQVIKQGYAFPDEAGEGVEEFVRALDVA